MALHAVIVACRHALVWLRPLCGQRHAAIFIYAKCGLDAARTAVAALGNCSNLEVSAADNNGRDFKVYLSHALRFHHALPTATFFVHDDFPMGSVADCEKRCDEQATCVAFDTDGSACFLKSACDGSPGTCSRAMCGYRRTE